MKNLLLLTVLIFIIGCQTITSNYWTNTISINVNKGIVELNIEIRIKDNYSDKPNAFDGLMALATFEPPIKESRLLKAGEGYSYTLKYNEVMEIKFKPIIDQENPEKPEMVIQYRGKNIVHKFKTKLSYSKTFKGI